MALTATFALYTLLALAQGSTQSSTAPPPTQTAPPQKPAQTQTPPQPEPPRPKPPEVELPSDLAKIRAAMQSPTSLDLVDKSPFRFFSNTVAPVPKFTDIVGDFDLKNGPVPHAGMTHQEFMQQSRPKDMYSSAGFTPGDVIRWGLLTYVEGKGFELVKKGLQELREARTEAERKAIRARIERELAALRGETIK